MCELGKKNFEDILYILHGLGVLDGLTYKEKRASLRRDPQLNTLHLKYGLFAWWI